MKRITVTLPLLPDLNEFHAFLQEIWDSRWITNNGHFHQQLEQALAEYLKLPYISLFTNGTLPLITALQALNIKGEDITTPYSFVATTHALWWNGITPVFVDVDQDTGNMMLPMLSVWRSIVKAFSMPATCQRSHFMPRRSITPMRAVRW